MDTLHHRYGLVGWFLTQGRKYTMFFAVCLVGMVGGHLIAQRLIRAIDEHRAAQAAAALASPITKWEFTVEETHGQGKYLIAQRGTWHLKLQCEGSQWKNKDGVWNNSDNCSAFHIGDKIVLEKWDVPDKSALSGSRKITYVNKMTATEGENDYVYYDGD